jgi:hypothetical protein
MAKFRIVGISSDHMQMGDLLDVVRRNRPEAGIQPHLKPFQHLRFRPAEL